MRSKINQKRFLSGTFSQAKLVIRVRVLCLHVAALNLCLLNSTIKLVLADVLSVVFICKYSKRRHVYTVINIQISPTTCYADLKLRRLLSEGGGHSKHVRSKGVYFKVRHHFVHQKCYIFENNRTYIKGLFT